MSLSEEERSIIVQMQLEKSDKFMSDAVKVAEMGMWDLVANRIYYSVFHAVAGMFVKDGIEVRSHKGTVIVFGQQYITSNKFDSKWGKLYATLQSIREKCDYNLVYVSSENEMRPLMTEAQQMIQAIKMYLS